MKRVAFILSIFIFSIFISCSNGIFLNDGSYSPNFDKDWDVNELSQLTQIDVDNETFEYLGISLDELLYKVQVLLRVVNCRSISANQYITDYDNLALMIQDANEDEVIPDFEHFDEVQMEKIRILLPDLTDEQILENFELIERFYNDYYASRCVEQLSQKLGRSSGARSLMDYYFTIKGEKVTLYEVCAAIKHPFSGLKVFQMKEIAENFANQYASNDKAGDKADAFRHAMWCFAMAKEAVGSKTEKMSFALDFSYAHEMGIKYAKYYTEMDIHNNISSVEYFNRTTTVNTIQILMFTIETGTNSVSYDTAFNYFKSQIDNATYVQRYPDFNKYLLEINKVPSSKFIINQL